MRMDNVPEFYATRPARPARGGATALTLILAAAAIGAFIGCAAAIWMLA